LGSRQTAARTSAIRSARPSWQASGHHRDDGIGAEVSGHEQADPAHRHWQSEVQSALTPTICGSAKDHHEDACREIWDALSQPMVSGSTTPLALMIDGIQKLMPYTPL
jgi:hypothetical protein